MNPSTPHRAALALAASVLVPGLFSAQEAPIAASLEASSEDVRIYNDHIVTLASPWMEGRLPGTRGMELAKEYMEFWMKDVGLEPAFGGSWRQAFPLAGTARLKSSSLVVNGTPMSENVDYAAMGFGGSGSFEGEAVYVGYSLGGGTEDDYRSYAPGNTSMIEGKVAVMFRFEPMDENGESLLSDNGQWSPRAGFMNKFRAAERYGAKAILLINPPGCSDERSESILPFSGAGRGKVPIFHVSTAAGEKLAAAMAGGQSLMDLRRMADKSGVLVPLEGKISLSADITTERLEAENVGGILRGKGDLAGEYVVIGAHLDHLGMGKFGSRADRNEQGRVLHPGADDNASGSAGILMIADKMAADYDALPEGSNARSVIFIGFSAEESGLNGSQYYVENPPVPIEDHALMINFDMIGRIKNKRLSVSGTQTAAGLKDMLQPLFEDSGLEIVQPEGISGASDHTPFLQKQMPILFGIIADFHDDYHTPRDTSSKINRIDAVHTVNLFYRIGMAVGTHPEAFEFQSVGRRGARPTASRASFKVRFGIRPGNYDGATPGILVAGVTEGTSADEGGLREEDLIVSWNGKDVKDVQSWMPMLAEHEPGDVVNVGVQRGSEVLVLKVTLKGRDDG